MYIKEGGEHGQVKKEVIGRNDSERGTDVEDGDQRDRGCVKVVTRVTEEEVNEMVMELYVSM